MDMRQAVGGLVFAFLATLIVPFARWRVTALKVARRGIHVGLAAMGVGIGVGLTGLGMSTAVGRNPGAFTQVLVHGILAIAFTEAIVFYALFLLGH